MRLRATRLSVTGGHARKRGIDIAALFAGYPGRVGCYYGTKAGPSYTDILARNREALGPELVAGGWTTPVSYDNTVTDQTATSFATSGGTTQSRVGSLLTGSAAGKTVFVIGRLKSAPASGTVTVYLRDGSSFNSGALLGTAVVSAAGYFSFFTQLISGATSFLAISSSNGVSYAVDNISVREIVDWQKLVLFDDPAGTVPVFSVFQSSRGRGLLLDSSQGLVRGAEALANGDFASGATGWTVTGNDATHIATFAGGTLRYQSDTTSPTLLITQTGALVSGKVYEIVTSVSAYTSGSMKSDSFNGVILASRVGENRVIATATTTVFGITRSTANVDMTIDSISVRELPGNHMVQPTAAARGEVSARYNLLTATDGSDASWAKTGVSEKLTETATTGIHELRTNSVALTAGMSYTQMARVYRIGARRYFRLGASGAFGAGGYCVFDLVTGTVTYTSAAAVVGSMTEVSPGVFDCFIRFTPSVSTSATNYLGVNEDATTGTSFAGIAGDGIGFLGADLRLSADVIPSIPSYQRVTSATDYDEVGFPVYWRGQTDDWAKTRINPNGATKALVMWAGQKMSDAAVGCLFESSVNWGGTVGSFGVFHSPGPGAKFGSRSSGSNIGLSIADTGTAYPAPVRSVLRHYSSIPTDECQLSVNAVQAATASADQGSGSYTEQDMYFGARAGSSLFSNIREFAPPLVLFQPTADTGLSAAQVVALDKAFAKAVGVSL